MKENVPGIIERRSTSKYGQVVLFMKSTIVTQTFKLPCMSPALPFLGVFAKFAVTCVEMQSPVVCSPCFIRKLASGVNI